MPFEQAATELAFFWHVELEETTVRRCTQAAGAAYVAEQVVELERLERERPAAPAGPAVQYLSADGAIVPLVSGELAEVKRWQSARSRCDLKRMRCPKRTRHQPDVLLTSGGR
jgi:hypothetical protein